MTSSERPSPSVPIIIASLSAFKSLVSSIPIEFSQRAIETVIKPSDLSLSMFFGLSFDMIVHGILKILPILTLIARLYKGSAQSFVKSIASMLSAAALLTMAPTFVGFTTPSRTVILLAPLSVSSIAGSFLRLIAQRKPLVTSYPVIPFKVICEATYTGISLTLERTSRTGSASSKIV